MQNFGKSKSLAKSFYLEEKLWQIESIRFLNEFTMENQQIEGQLPYFPALYRNSSVKYKQQCYLYKVMVIL